jgi:adenine-specific DNA-methyltransferase
MDKMTEQDGGSLDIVNENLEVLKTIFPDAFTEEGVDFDVLRQLLGGEIDDGEEKYGLNWHGKKKARQIALTPSTGTLRPCPEESVDWDTTQNLFIGGDNLEVLKLLQKTYAGKVKMIYIDPPYNTGNEFIYPDRFQDNLDTYLKYTGQVDAEGMKFSSNAEQSGRYHTNWLNMMYPRLKLARNVLTQDGVILVSIADHELSNMLTIMNEIYGEENRVAIFSWKSRAKPTNAGNSKYRPQKVAEYVLVYGRQPGDEMTFNVESSKKRTYPHEDDDGKYRATTILTSNRGTFRRETMRFESGGYTPDEDNRWKAGKEVIDNLFARNHILFTKDGIPMEKKYEHEEQDPLYPIYTFMDPALTGTAESGKTDLNEIIGNQHGLDTVKPVQLIKYLTATFSDSRDIVLDFFAGSCTTAQAIYELNQEGSAGRQFVLVQLPELIEQDSEAFKAGFNTIAEIGKERIRRAASKIKEENPGYEGDLGFKVFKLDNSNIRAWNPDRGDLEQTLLDHTEHLVEGRGEQDLLCELLLKRGVDQNVPIEEKTISGKTVYSIGYGVLFACLDTAISQEEVEGLAQGIIDWHKELIPTSDTQASDTQVVFRDSAFSDDITKTNMTAILEQHGIAHVRSL